MDEKIPEHWHDNSSEGSTGDAFRRSDGRCAMEMSQFGRFRAGIPGLVFPMEQAKGESLVDFMTRVDETDPPRIPRKLMLPCPPVGRVTEDRQIYCMLVECRWKKHCACYLACTDRTMLPDLEARIRKPEQPELNIMCKSYAPEEAENPAEPD